MINTINHVVGEMNDDMADMNEHALYTQLAKDLKAKVLNEDVHAQTNWTRQKMAIHAAYLNSLVMHQT